MNPFLKLTILMMFVFSFFLQANAEIYRSPNVQTWLEQTNQQKSFSEVPKQMKILVLLKSNELHLSMLPLRKSSALHHLKKFKTQFSLLNDGRPINHLWAINGFTTYFKASELERLLKYSQVLAVYDAEQKISIQKQPELAGLEINLNVDHTYGLKNIKVPDLKKIRPELTGSGVKVGVLDTGIYAKHPDLIGRLGRYKNFSPSPDNSVVDPFGHGSHVSGTIAGGSMSRVAIGVAPQAELVVGRIFDGNGESTKELILKAMQWMLDPDENPETTDDIPRVVNNSWGDSDPYNDRDPQEDPFCLMIDSWNKAGIVAVFTAGNSGPRPRSINVPGACPGSLTVGATEQYDRSPHFSSEGPTSWKTVEIIKPDVVAPGVKIKSVGNYGNEYEEMSGTSMAAPHVSGALALLFQARPELTNAQAIELMKAGVKDLGNPGLDTIFGFGRIDILKSVELANSVTGVSF